MDFISIFVLPVYYFKPKSGTSVLLMKISLYERKLKDGRISLSIEFYKGAETNAEGKRRHLRDYENLQIYLHSDPKTLKEKKENKENERIFRSWITGYSL